MLLQVFEQCRITFFGDIHTILVTIVIAPLVLMFISRVYRAHFHLCDFPGPPVASYTRLWLSRTLGSGNAHEIFVKLTKDYGDIVRVAPNLLITSDPKLTRKILAPNSGFDRASGYEGFRIDPRITNAISSTDTKHHKKLRRLIEPAYAGRDLADFDTVIDDRIQTLIQSLERRWLSSAHSFRVFDIAEKIQFLAIDVMTELAMGRRFGMLEADNDTINYTKNIKRRFQLLQQLSVFPILNSILYWMAMTPFLGDLMLAYATELSGMSPVVRMSRDAIHSQVRDSGLRTQHMASSFLKQGMSQHYLETELAIALVGGTDSTATAIRSALLSLISSPVAYNRLQMEIDEAAMQGRISSPVKTDEARRLPYLQAVIRESLRRHPPIVQLRERVVPPGGLTLDDGRHIPAGTWIGFDAWSTQNNTIFGDNADVFNPDRWFVGGDDSQRMAEMIKTQSLVFGHGPTRCPGINIATNVLNKSLVEIMRRYNIELAEPKMWSSVSFGVFFQKELIVKAVRRT